MQTVVQRVTSSYDTHLLLVGYEAGLFALSQVSTLIDPREMSEELMNIDEKRSSGLREAACRLKH